jgi:hypothetical protein
MTVMYNQFGMSFTAKKYEFESVFAPNMCFTVKQKANTFGF